MAVLMKYNYGLIYRRLSSKYFNMHEYSLLEGQNLWDWKDWEFDNKYEDSTDDNNIPERDIIFLSDNERKMIEIPNRRILYVAEDTGGMWIWTTRWILLNPSIEGVKTISINEINRIVGIGGIDEDEDDITNPKFFSDIIFTTNYQRKHLLTPRTETLYVTEDTNEFYIYDKKWVEVSLDPNTTKVRAISTGEIDDMVAKIEAMYQKV